MELGADDFLTKPCTAAELLAAIASRFEKHETVLNQSRQQLDNLRHSITLSLPHELRTPLNGIMGLAEVLIHNYDQIEQQLVLDIAEGIQSSAQRLYRLIQNFLFYAELEVIRRDRDRLEALQRGETHYSSMIITNVATQIAQQQNRQADLHLDLQNSAVQISDLHLSKVVEELTDNAFKFSEPGTAVSLSSLVDRDKFILSICDRGRGIAVEHIAQLGAYMQFDRAFYEQQGSGLGFTIAHHLVELYGGKISVESVLGQQTTVQIKLPLCSRSAESQSGEFQ
jgi:signal transduction histidine kinase